MKNEESMRREVLAGLILDALRGLHAGTLCTAHTGEDPMILLFVGQG